LAESESGWEAGASAGIRGRRWKKENKIEKFKGTTKCEMDVCRTAFKGAVIVGTTSVSGIHCSGLEVSAHFEGLMDPLLDAVRGQGSLWQKILASTHELASGLPRNREHVRDISCMQNFQIEPLAWLLSSASFCTLDYIGERYYSHARSSKSGSSSPILTPVPLTLSLLVHVHHQSLLDF
jgi:hypothetical protein